MKLTDTQIQDLYNFTLAHYVEHYDLQTELVDHLANDIETMWIEQPQLSYQEAKNKAFKKFGVYGFMKTIEQRQKAMNKRYFRYLWTELKQWFQLPKIVLTITLFFGYYLIFKSSFSTILFVTSLIGLWCIYRGIQLNRAFRKRKENSNKKWLLEEIIFKQNSGVVLVFFSQLASMHNLSDRFLSNEYIVVLFAFLFTGFIFMSYISFKVLPEKAEHLLKNTYPEYKLAK